MSYEKHTWETGELITADKLNHMEEGIEGGGGSGDSAIIVHAVYNETTETWLLDKTNEELYALFEEGKPIFVEREETYEVNGFTHAYKGLGQIIVAEYITGEDEGTEVEEWDFMPSSGYGDRFYGYWKGVKSDLPPYWVDDNKEMKKN